MANVKWAEISQSTRENRGWIADFTDDLPSSITVTSGTAYHTPPSGAAGTPTIVAASPYITATLGTAAVTVTGIHYLDVVATYSNGETAQVRIAFNVGYASTQARAGMVDLVARLRQMTHTGPADYEIAGVPYWSDAQLQDILDRRRTFIYREELTSRDSYNNGTLVYLEHYSQYGNLETGANLELEYTDGTTAGTALYTVNAVDGIFTFANSTEGTVFYLNGRSFDMNRAAADVWREKSGHYVLAYDFSTDNHSLKRSQMMAQCLSMASYYAGKAGPGMISMERSDT